MDQDAGEPPADPGRLRRGRGHRGYLQRAGQLEIYGRDGLPVLSPDGHQIQGWITAPAVLRAIARQITASQPATAQDQAAADWDHAEPSTLTRDPPTPLPGYQLVEITIAPGSPAAGRKLGASPGRTPARPYRSCAAASSARPARRSL